MWQAAHRLAEYLEAVVSDVGLDRPGAKILELGAGTGWLSMVLARNLPDADRVVATEMASGGALDWLRRNVRKNESLAEERGCRLWPPGDYGRKSATGACIRAAPERQRLRRRRRRGGARDPVPVRSRVRSPGRQP